VLRIGAVVLTGVAFVFWDRPTGKVVLLLTAILVVVLAVIEFLGRPPAESVEEPPPAPS
jgi:chromate transport protein ChrA